MYKQYTPDHPDTVLIGDEYSVTRKVKEMILATRIESVLTKQEILELYLNEIPLGRRSFGVQAASRAPLEATPRSGTHGGAVSAGWFGFGGGRPPVVSRC